MAKVTGPAIRPRRLDERAYETALRTSILNPLRAKTEEVIRQAHRTYEAIRQDILHIPLDPSVRSVSQTQAVVQMARLKKYQTDKFTRMMRKFLGLNISLFDDPAIAEYLTAQIRANIDLIVTIQPRFHDALNSKLLKLQQDEPFNQAKLRGCSIRNTSRPGTTCGGSRVTRRQKPSASLTISAKKTSGLRSTSGQPPAMKGCARRTSRMRA